MTRLDGLEGPMPEFPPISPHSLLALSANAQSCGGAPFLVLACGRDHRSWGISVVAGNRVAKGSPQGVERLLDARWRRDLLELPDVTLLAQSALRKLSLERGWPIP